MSESPSLSQMKNAFELTYPHPIASFDPDSLWQVSVVINDDNLTYLAYHQGTREALWIDPVLEDWDLLVKESQKKSDYRWIGVIDTHTHADHLSCAGKLARHLNTPLIMHHHAPTPGVHLRVCQDTTLHTSAGPLQFLITPGHTADGLVIQWGSFIFTGDTILFKDTGRNDLPTGDPVAHAETLEKLKKRLSPDHWVLPGHDSKGGRFSTWAFQLENNPSLLQSKDDFIQDAAAFTGPAPVKFKESLFYNFK